jgi:hypothetical protein
MINAFTSSAIESVKTTEDGNLLITFNGGREYTYGVADSVQFESDFNAATSKGQFVNTAIRSEQLRALVAA